MDAQEKSELFSFGFRVLAALSRLIALALFIGAHFCLNFALKFVMPDNMAGMLLFSQDVIAVIFLLLYAYLTWDMLRAFIPQLHRLTRTSIEPSERVAESNDDGT
jgi:hypothetical protein